MNIRDAMLPWLAISRLRSQLSDLHADYHWLQGTLDEARTEIDDRARETASLQQDVKALRAQVAKFDGDKDGKIGGSKKRVKS